MRNVSDGTISATLLAKQKGVSQLLPRTRVVLTHPSLTNYTYYITDRTLEVKDHTEDPWRQEAAIILNNHDKALNAIDFSGYKAVIGYGFSATGDEYADCAPLWVIPQSFRSAPDVTGLTCTLKAVGLPDLLFYDRANASYSPQFTEAAAAPTDPSTGDFWKDTGTSTWYTYNGAAWVAKTPPTVKDIILAVIGNTGDYSTYITVYDHCESLTITWDSEDSLIDSYTPKDTFAIQFDQSRLAVLRQLLAFTKCLVRAEGDGNLHVFDPTVTGTSYDGEYKQHVLAVSSVSDNTDARFNTASAHGLSNGDYVALTGFSVASYNKKSGTVTVVDADTFELSVSTGPGAFTKIQYSASDTGLAWISKGVAANHTFDHKTYANRLLIPNKVSVQTYPNAYNAYSGSAQTTGYAALPTAMQKTKFFYAALASNAEANTLAAALLAKFQLNSQIGSVHLPVMDCAVEVGDYIKVWDDRDGLDRVGNVASITRNCKPGRTPDEPTIYSCSISFGGWLTADDLVALLETYSDEYNSMRALYVKNLTTDLLELVWVDPDGNIDLTKIGDNIDSLSDGELYARYRYVKLDASGFTIVDATRYSLAYRNTAGTDVEVQLYKHSSAPAADYQVTGNIWIDTSGSPNVTKIWDGAAWTAATAAQKAALASATVSRRTKESSLTADGLIVLDNVSTGTYGLLLQTDISAGHINLTASAVKAAEWYVESGVIIDADAGIHIYGTSGAFTTSAVGTAITAFANPGGGEVTITSTSHGLVTGDYAYIRGTTNYNGSYTVTKLTDNTFKITATYTAEAGAGFVALIQTYVGTDGNFYAVGGDIAINALGINLNEQSSLIFRYSGATIMALISARSDGLDINAGSNYITVTATALASSGSFDLGLSGAPITNIYATNLYATNLEANLDGTGKYLTISGVILPVLASVPTLASNDDNMLYAKYNGAGIAALAYSMKYSGTQYNYWVNVTAQ